MPANMSAPATKADIAQILKILAAMQGSLSSEFQDFREETLDRFNRIDERHYAFEMRMHEELSDIRQEIQAGKVEMKLHFDAAVEIIRHDLVSANREEISNIKDRVTRLERHPRLRAV